MKVKSHEELRAELEDLAALPDEKIDLSDQPEVLDFSTGVRGRFYRPVKKAVTMRVDADILEWFKARNPHYQTAINKALREYVQARSKQNATSNTHPC